MSLESKVWFAELTMKEVEEAVKANKVIILPVGSVEEHGSHLPLCTDSLQPEYVAVEVAKKTGSLVAPPLNYGVCTVTRVFPGTISISFQSLYRITKEVVEEFVRNGFKRFLILSGHADEEQMAALRLAAYYVMWKYGEEVEKRKLRIMVCSDYDFAYELRGKYFDEMDGHGGTIETSRVMAIKPELIRGKERKNLQKLPRFEITANPKEFLPNGIRGDPAAASVEKGKFINDYIIGELVKLIEELKK
ncbi:MAG: creatininase family protein [Candidatus Bathyarchaeia archaeon]